MGETAARSRTNLMGLSARRTTKGVPMMTQGTGRLTDVKVLIVDDDRDVLESMDAASQSEGALTQVAMDGNDAVRICREEPPDIVILDMMLPKRSGFLALEKIKGYEDSP